MTPELKALIVQYKEVFGPLPPHNEGKGCKLLEIDIELREEFKTLPFRSKCWPMPPQDCSEIKAQVDELVASRLLEPFPPGEFTNYCPPTFLVDKKKSKIRIMVGQYVKHNKRSKHHVGWLPNMELLVENMSKTKFKSKLDLRSGFWQVGLTPRAQELSAITTPNGRCFRWLCMPFGLQGAPGVFQEMIEILCAKVRNNPKLKGLWQNAHIGAFFDDCGLGAQSQEEHLLILETLFQECLNSHKTKQM